MPDWQSQLNADPIPWLLEQEAPWVRYHTLKDLLDKFDDDAEVLEAREEIIAHHRVKELVAKAADWPGYPLTRHNDAKHPIHALTVLVDFGLTKEDPGMDQVIAALLEHQAPEGAFQSLIQVPKAFGGTDEESWTWMLCDAPTLLYALAKFDIGEEGRLEEAAQHIVSLIQEDGWPCAASPDLGKFRGPGRKDDPCPYANLIAVKALAAVSPKEHAQEIQTGVKMLLDHWENQKERKIYMFGIGTTYKRLKYPLIWYDLLHVLDVLSQLPFTHGDTRFKEMLEALVSAQDEEGKFKAGSVWTAWKGWDFGQKREPSPWITFLVLNILKRVYSS